MTLLDTTLRELKKNGKTPEDIHYIQTSEFKISWENFKRVADFELNSEEYYAPIVVLDLIIVGDGWWLERETDYDYLVDYWVYREYPKELPNLKEITESDLVNEDSKL